MSAGSMRFSGYFDFYFNSIQQGGEITGQIELIDSRTRALGRSTQQAAGQTASYSSGLRRLALDLRLISSGIRQVVSTLGLQDTLVGKAADGITVLASSAVVAISTFNAWHRINTMFAGQMLGATMMAIQKLTPVVAFLAANLLPIIAIIALLVVGFMAINYVWGQTSGITRYQESIKNLKEDVEGLESSLRSLRLEQGQLSVQSQVLAVQQANLDEALALGAISADVHAQKSEALAANQAVLGRQTAELTLTERVYSTQLDQNKAAIEDYEQAIKDTNQAKWDILTGKSQRTGPSGMQSGRGGAQQGPGLMDYFWSLLGFASGGIVSATGPIMAHAGEQLIPEGEVGGGAVSLTISLDGANIYGREGLEQALEVGGNKIRKQLEYMRRPRTRW